MAKSTWVYLCSSLLGVLLLAGCGGGGSSSAPAVTTVSGSAVKGIIQHGRVTAEELDNDGTVLRTVGAAVTGITGKYSITVDGTYAGGPLKITVDDANDANEPTTVVCDVADANGGCGSVAFGQPMPIGTLQMSALHRGSASAADLKVHITPYTDAATSSALAKVTDPVAPEPLDGALVDESNQVIASLLGIADLLETDLPDLSDNVESDAATTDELEYALLVSALANLAFNDPNLNVGTDPVADAVAQFASNLASGDVDVDDAGTAADATTISLAEIFAAALAEASRTTATQATQAQGAITNAQTTANGNAGTNGNISLYPDGDGDGVPDYLDLCPNEDATGRDANHDGCIDPGVVVTAANNLTTTEAGGTATFTVVLQAAPSADVVIGLSSNDATEGIVTPASVTFTSANWNVARMVTATGVDDNVDDGNIAYSVVIAAATSTDTGYNGIGAASVAVINTDDDVAGITVSAISGPTTESGGTATFTVVLDSEPTADVSVAISSDNTAEGTAAPASLLFTAGTNGNWNTPHTVTVTGVDDSVIDGDITYNITTAQATGSDTKYSVIDPADVTVINIDNDIPGITVNPTGGLVTTEAGGTAAFTVVLNTQPSASVSVGLTSSDTFEGTVAPASVTFTSTNWDTPQTVTVTGVDDNVDDGDIAFSIVTAAATSTDADYTGFDASNVAITNTDDDTAGISVGTISGPTTEAGGSATFTLVLDSEPTANVSVGLVSDDTTEGAMAPASVTFTAANYATPQTVTVTGVNDNVDDGDLTFNIVTTATSTDANYGGILTADVAVTNTDDDTAGISVGAISGATAEAGGTATFTVVLDSEPTANVSVGLSSDDTTEGTVAPASVTFTAANWNTPQTVTATGVDDNVDDGDIVYNIVTAAATSTDTKYSGINAADAAITNTDDDTAGISLGAVSGPTTEAGGTATFTVVLNSEPIANVSVGLSSDDTTEGFAFPGNVTFTAANWNIAQAVTATGVNDDVADGDITYNIVTAAATSADANYSGINPTDAAVINIDDDVAGITVSAISGNTTELGGSATFSVVLNSEPAANVTVGLSSDDTTEGTVSPASVTFTALNWNAAQMVTVTGVNDAILDGDITYHIVTALATSTDAKYSVINPADVTLVNIDDDVPGVTVNPISGLVTTESGGTATFTVVLNVTPAANVSFALSSSDTTEGTVLPASVTFTPANWNVAQTVTVTGVDDVILDGTQPYTIVTGATTSTDVAYNAINPNDVSANNLDNDAVAGITVTPTSLTTNEAGNTTDSFTIVLDIQPLADVSISITSGDTTEGTVNASGLTFTAANWATPQMVTVTAVTDGIIDGNQVYSVFTGAAVSADTQYNGMNSTNVSVINVDDGLGTPGVTVSPASGLTTSESPGGADTFTVVLATIPTGNVTLNFTSSDTTEGTVSPSSLIFTPGTSQNLQTITVTGVDDPNSDGTVAYNITTAVTSTDAVYNGIAVTAVGVTNTDNEMAPATLTGTVSYAGAKTGPIYLRVNTGGFILGTGILSPGAYSIRGVPPFGTHAVEAWMDHVGRGGQNAASPFGTATVTVSTGGVVSVPHITLTDPTGITPMQIPAAPDGLAFDSGAAVFWAGVSTPNNADSYNLYWHTNTSVSKSNFIGSVTGIPSLDGGWALLTGLTNGTSYYFVVTEVVNGVEGVESAVSVAMVPNSVTGGLTASGTVTLPAGVTTGGPLFVVYEDAATGVDLIDVIPAGASGTVAYSVPGLSAGLWEPILILDNDGDGIIGDGDVDSSFLNPPISVVGNTTHNLTLSMAGASTRFSTRHFVSGSFHDYNVALEVSARTKVPLSVTISTGNGVLPVDLGNEGLFTDLYNLELRLGSFRPSVGDTYTIDITYTDGSSETLSRSITAVLDNAPVPTFPLAASTGVSTVPTFTWTVPGGAAADQFVNIFVNQGVNFLWGSEGFIPAASGTAVYDFDGVANAPSLTLGLLHNWSITLQDGDANKVSGPAENFTP